MATGTRCRARTRGSSPGLCQQFSDAAGLQIGILANKGISATDIKKLKDFGLHTVADIQHTTTKTMLNIKGLSEAKVMKIKDVARSETGNAFMSGSELRQKRECGHAEHSNDFLHDHDRPATEAV